MKIGQYVFAYPSLHSRRYSEIEILSISGTEIFSSPPASKHLYVKICFGNNI